MFRKRTATKKPTFLPSNTEPTSTFINEVILLASKKFISGPFYAKDHPQKKSKSFLRRTNRIPDTNFIAAPGPKTTVDLMDFFIDIASQQPPITHIVALGNRLSEGSNCTNKEDFLNYFMGDEACDFGMCHVERKIIKGRALFSPRHNYSKPNVFVQSEITLGKGEYALKIQVTGIELADGDPLHISHESMKELLWQLAQTAKTEQMLLHCKQGHGRTGSLILTLLLIMLYHSVFASNDPETVANNILVLVEDMRSKSNRPRLIHHKEQFEAAILNAHLIHQYALEKGYIKIEEPIKSADFGKRRVRSCEIFHHRAKHKVDNSRALTLNSKKVAKI